MGLKRAALECLLYLLCGVIGVVVFGCEESEPLTDMRGADAETTDVSPRADGSTIDLGRGRLDVAIPTLDALLDATQDSDVVDANVSSDVGAPRSCQDPSAVLEHVAWGPVLRSKCYECHKPGGYARGCSDGQFCANFELLDPFAPGVNYDDVMTTNLEQVATNLELFEDGGRDQPKLLLKATGRLGHGGGVVISPPDEEGMTSPNYRALERLVEALRAAGDESCVESEIPVEQLLEPVRYTTPAETWRRITIQVAGRLPTEAERTALTNALDPEAADRVLGELFDGLRHEPGVHAWLKEAWNEIFMFRGAYHIFYDHPFSIFSIHDFAARMWADMRIFHPRTVRENEDGHFERVNACERYAEDFGYPGYPGGSPVELCRSADGSRDFTLKGIGNWVPYGAIESPLELIAHVIKMNRPFSEIVTSTEIMMNYYTANVYFGPDGTAQQRFADAPMHPALPVSRNPGSPTVSMPDHRYFLPIDEMRMTNLRPPEIPNREDVPEGCLDEDEDGSWEITCRVISPKPTAEYRRAGIISTPVFMSRYPSNQFNRNRHRAWQTLRLFLDLDVLEGAARTVNITDHNGDAYPTFSDPSCSGCHETLDPIAGLFQSFNVSVGSFQGDIPSERRRPLWPPAGLDSDGDGQGEPGFHATGAGTIADGELFDFENEPSMIQFLGRKLVADHRFAPAMVSHAWRQVFGGHRPSAIQTPDDAHFNERAALIKAQRRFYGDVVEAFRGDGLNMWTVYRRLFLSSWYRVDGVRSDIDETATGAYQDLSLGGPATPEHFMRRVEAVLGRPWPHNAPVAGYATPGVPQDDFLLRTDSAKQHLELRLGLIDSDFASFFGGIDFLNTTERATAFNSVMALVIDRVSNEFACVAVPYDLSMEPAQRTFFSGVGNDELYDPNRAEVDMRFRQTVVDLFQRVLGVTVAPDSVDVSEALSLWQTAHRTAVERYGASGAPFVPHCVPSANGPSGGGRNFDPGHVARSWMAVMTYLVRQPEFIARFR